MCFFLVLLVISIVVTIMSCRKFKDKYWEGVYLFITVICWIMTGTLFLILIVVWCSNGDTYGELMAYTDVYRSYVQTVADSKDAVVLLDGNAAITIIPRISLENIEHSVNVLDRIRETRDKVVWYKETVGKYKVWRSC